MNTTQTNERFSLDLDVEQVRNEIAEQDHETPAQGPGVDPELEAKAIGYARHLLAIESEAHDEREHARAGVERMGGEIQKRCARRSRMLQAPIREIAGKAEDGGDVANALTSLKEQVEDLDPGSLDLKAGWLSRTLSRIPGVGTLAARTALTLPGDATTYERHRPEHTPLYGLIEEHFPRFVERLEAEGASLPRFVSEEFEAYLKCGRLEYG